MKYTLINPKELPATSQADVEKYGKAFWSDTHDSDKPVMFNLMSGTVGDGAQIEFEESVNKESAKGTEYLRLRKVKVLSTGTTEQRTAPETSTKLLELIYDDTQEILRLLSVTAPPKSLRENWNETTTKEDTVIEDIGDGPISLDQIPF